MDIRGKTPHGFEYQIWGQDMAIRSGRFTFPDRKDKTGSPHTFVNLGAAGKGAGYYRVLNSGQHLFKIHVLNRSNVEQSVAEIAIGDSVDFALDVSDKLSVSWEAPPTNELPRDVDGIYNFLGDADSNSLEEIRSGRVKGIAVVTMPPKDGTKFVEFGAHEKATAIYRIFNSSHVEPFELFSNGNSLGIVKPRFSLDVAPELGADVTVKAAADKEVELIYDFLAGAVK